MRDENIITDKLTSIGFGIVDYITDKCNDVKTGRSFFRLGTPGLDSILLNYNGDLARHRKKMSYPPLDVSDYFMFMFMFQYILSYVLCLFRLVQ